MKDLVDLEEVEGESGLRWAGTFLFAWDGRYRWCGVLGSNINYWKLELGFLALRMEYIVKSIFRDEFTTSKAGNGIVSYRFYMIHISWVAMSCSRSCYEAIATCRNQF